MVVEEVVGFFVGIQVQSVLDFDGENESVGVEFVEWAGREFKAFVEFFRADAARAVSSRLFFELFIRMRRKTSPFTAEISGEDCEAVLKTFNFSQAYFAAQYIAE